MLPVHMSMKIKAIIRILNFWTSLIFITITVYTIYTVYISFTSPYAKLYISSMFSLNLLDISYIMACLAPLCLLCSFFNSSVSFHLFQRWRRVRLLNTPTSCGTSVLFLPGPKSTRAWSECTRQRYNCFLTTFYFNLQWLLKKCWQMLWLKVHSAFSEKSIIWKEECLLK